jgi:hypothetical protein
MSAGPVKHEVSNIPGANQHTNGVLPKAPPVVRLPPRANTSASSSTYATAQAVKASDGTKTETKVEEAKVEGVKAEEAKTETLADRQSKRREEWSALNEARKLKKEAEELTKQAASFEQVKNSPQKLQALARSMGLTSDELLLTLQKERMSIPTDKVLTAAEQQEQNAKQYEERLTAQEQRIREMEFHTAKSSHINKAILPPLVKEPETFEFCHKYGIDRVASEVYDYCNKLHMEGNPQNEVEVLKEFETALYEEWETNFNAGKGLKKTSKYFDKAVPAGDATEALGATQQTAKEAAVQMAEPAKRIAKRDAPAASATDMNKLSNNNKLEGGVKTGVTFDRAERRRRILNGE